MSVNLNRLYHININVTDLDRSIALAFHVDNIEEVHEELQRMGVKMLGPLEFMTGARRATLWRVRLL